MEAGFRLKLSRLADDALQMAGRKHGYSGQDIVNASLVFMEVLMSLTYDRHVQACSKEQLSELANEVGQTLHQTILLATGIDIKEVSNEN